MKANIEWSMVDFSGPTRLDADLTTGPITNLLTVDDSIFAQVADVRSYNDEYKFWGISYALSEIDVYETT